MDSNEIVGSEIDNEINDNLDGSVFAELEHHQIKFDHRAETRPSIDDLPDAVQEIDGELVFALKPGENVIIERYFSFMKDHPWMDTQIYRVDRIDHESGTLFLYNKELQQQALSNFKTGITDYGYRFKVPMKKKHVLKTRRRRGGSPQAVNEPSKKKIRTNLRRLYNVKGVVLLRFKNRGYIPPEGSQIQSNDRVEVTSSDNSSVNVKHPTLGYEETWSLLVE